MALIYLVKARRIITEPKSTFRCDLGPLGSS